MVNHHKYEEKSDEELVVLSLKDPSFFFYLIKRYEEKLIWYITRISKLSIDDVKDILQEVFIKTYYNLNDFDPKLKFSSWIYRIAHNQTISEIRKRKVRPFIFFDEEEIEKIEYDFDLEKDIDNKINNEKINQALSNLDEKYREVLILRFLDDKDYVEIADILKKPISTVGNLIARGKKLFKVEYDKLIK